jgi:hypothetical protein
MVRPQPPKNRRRHHLAVCGITQAIWRIYLRNAPRHFARINFGYRGIKLVVPPEIYSADIGFVKRDLFPPCLALLAGEFRQISGHEFWS